MKKVLLVGNYGVSNLGDDMLMHSSILQLESLGIEYKLVCPGQILNSLALPPAGVRSLLSFKWLEFFKELKSCDSLVFGGGGLLNPEEPRSIFIWGQIIAWAKIFGKDVYMAGQSFSRINYFVKKLINQVEVISVRDQYSFNLIKDVICKNKLKNGQDLAWYLPVNTENNKKYNNRAALNLRLFKYVDENYLRNVVTGLLQIMQKEYGINELVLLPFDESDLSFMHHILKDFKGVKIIESENKIEKCLEYIKGSKFVIAERLHANIACMKMEACFISLSYSSKVFSLLSNYNQEAIINLRKDSEVDFERIIRTAVLKGYKKPHPVIDEVFKCILSS